ncbi:MAG TPA: proton-conducting transporter membrane subunit [Solirubrobacterales bacterium]|nr:proton-conducting transporter membrane subunit [Solirubrobacterales bacterium]
MGIAEAVAVLGAVALLVGTGGPLLRLPTGVALGLQALGIGLAGAAGAVVFCGAAPIGAGFHDGLAPALGVDGLSGFFLATIAIVALPALAYGREYLRGAPRERWLVALGGLFLLALGGVVTARDASIFLAAWELMTLAPAAAILVRRADAEVRHVVFVYLAVTHLGGTGVWICMLALAHYGAFTDPGAFAQQGAAVQTLVIVAALVGFGTKAGLMPLHAWLPRAHPVAPSNFSALMSGVMVKVAIYGLVRVLFEWAAPVPLWVGMTLLAAGLLSALGGVLFALVQRDLKRLLAFSSIENVGIVTLGLGAAIVFLWSGDRTWAALAFAAALLHVLNHAVFKSLLFLAAGSFERAVGSLELDRLAGLLRRMPWTGAAFLVGAAAIAGVPPLNGFVSEWLTLQALVHAAFGPALGTGLAGGVAAAGLAATAAIALFCFVKATGLVLLGAPRRPAAATAVEPGTAMRLAPLCLAAGCVALAAVPGLLLPALVKLAPGAPVVAAHPALEVPGTGSLPSPWLLLGIVVLTAVAWRLRGKRRAAPVPAWACGQRVEPALQWTSAGFTKPLVLVLQALLRPQREVEVTRRSGLVSSVSYRGEIPHRFDTHLYRPLRSRALAAAAVVRRIQSGSVRAYAAYLLALVLTMLVLLRIGAIG